jgi:hypothetical protein
MRIRVLSDLHREFGTTDLPDITADVVILAGDIDRGIKGVTWERRVFQMFRCCMWLATTSTMMNESEGCIKSSEKQRTGQTSQFWRMKYLNWADGAFSVPRSGRTSISLATATQP